MIKFDASQLRVEYVQLKHVTTSMGGSIMVANDVNGKEEYSKIPVPFNVARVFIDYYKMAKYLVPVRTALCYYGDRIIAMQRHPFGGIVQNLEHTNDAMDQAIENWVGEMPANIEEYIKPLTAEGEWLFDGTFIYQLDQHAKPTQLSADKMFSAVVVDSINISRLHETAEISHTKERTCMVIKIGDIEVMSAPIWKDLSKLKGRSTKEGVFMFDAINEYMAPSLNFALTAGKMISESYGYDAIDILNLPSIMVDLCTVNLPNVEQHIKSRYDIGVPFKSCVAWLMGLQYRSDDFDTFIIVRQLLKYLTTQGIFFKAEVQVDNVLLKGKTYADVKMVSVESAKKREFSIDELHRSTLSRVHQQPNLDGSTIFDAE